MAASSGAMRLKAVDGGVVHVRALGPGRNDNQPHTVLDSGGGDTDTGTLLLTSNNATCDTHHNTLQWCNTINTIQHQQNSQTDQQSDNFLQKKNQLQQNLRQNQRTLYNINNNNLAAHVHEAQVRSAAAARAICVAESSPDDSLLDYEDVQQSCSSVDTSPQDEDRGFDLSDTESLSDDGNLSGDHLQSHRGIVNPNYPGFQRFAHTLDYTIKTCSDTDFTDDDLDIDHTNIKHNATDPNTINNNNNNIEEDVEYKIDSVNRLDSVENIQKVFYDKPVLNLPLDTEEKRNNLVDSSEATISNLPSDEDLFHDSSDSSDIKLNLRNPETIVGDFQNEVHEELQKLHSPKLQPTAKTCVQIVQFEQELHFSQSDGQVPEETNNGNVPEQNNGNGETTEDTSETIEIRQEITDLLNETLENAISTNTFRGVEQDLEHAVKILNQSKDLSPSALKYNIEPNSDEPFEKVRVDPNEKLVSSDAFLSECKEKLEAQPIIEVENNENLPGEQVFPSPDNEKSGKNGLSKSEGCQDKEKIPKEEKTKNDKEKDDDSAVQQAKKIESNLMKKKWDINQQYGSLVTIPRRELGGKNKENLNRRSLPIPRNKKRSNTEILGGFDVYNIETAMPKIDLDAIESHLRAARDEERRRRTDREEIRRRLAMGSEDDYYNGTDRPGRKPSLQARLQSGMNLQICFMNETASDTESPNSDSECQVTEIKPNNIPPIKNKLNISSLQKTFNTQRPASLPLGSSPPFLKPFSQPMTEADFFARQARLQTEARMALAQAKEMAHMQMEIERQRQKKSPITEMVRSSLEKVGIPFPEERRRVSRQILTEMNLAQLQVIVNDLHTQIETLNENLVRFLMDRDDLHMEQDSMLVDIEDLTRYLGAKEQTVKDQKISTQNNNIPPPSPAPASPLSALNNTVKPRLHRIASLVKK